VETAQALEIGCEEVQEIDRATNLGEANMLCGFRINCRDPYERDRLPAQEACYLVASLLSNVAISSVRGQRRALSARIKVVDLGRNGLCILAATPNELNATDLKRQKSAAQPCDLGRDTPFS
jgi:hypothetical protein